jgi:hypothetical protein
VRKSRARHKKADIRIVTQALSDPREIQERVMQNCLRRMIVGDNADIVLSTCPLDIMKARAIEGPGGVIFDDERHKAGEWFLRLYRYRNGGCKLRGALDSAGHGDDTNIDNPHRDAEYLALMTDHRMANGVANLLADVIVFGNMPRWLSDIILHAGHAEHTPEQMEFMTAMTALKTIWLEFGSQSTAQLRSKYERQMQDRTALSQVDLQYLFAWDPLPQTNRQRLS